MLKRIRHIIRYIFSARYRTYCRAHQITEALQAHRYKDSISKLAEERWREHWEKLGLDRFNGS